MPVHEKIDIEALIVRAYREKAVHRLQRVGATALGLSGPRAPGGYMTDKVDTSSFSARAAAKTRDLQAQLAATPDVLLDLHDAVLSLPNFYIELLGGLDFVIWNEETAARNGHRIKVEPSSPASIVEVGRRGGSGPAQDDLLPVGVSRRLVVLVTSMIVILNGQRAERPYVPEVVIERMRPVYEGREKRASRYVPVYETGLHEIVEARATYAAWHAALSILATQLAGLPDIEVTGPTAPVKPWDQTEQILDDTTLTDRCDEPREAQKQRRRSKTSAPLGLGPSRGQSRSRGGTTRDFSSKAVRNSGLTPPNTHK